MGGQSHYKEIGQPHVKYLSHGSKKRKSTHLIHTYLLNTSSTSLEGEKLSTHSLFLCLPDTATHEEVFRQHQDTGHGSHAPPL